MAQQQGRGRAGAERSGPGRRARGLLALVVALLAGLAAAGPAAAAAPALAPTDRPGPPLAVPTAELAAGLRCSGDLRGGREPVLLVPGTTLTPEDEFSWSWQPALTRAGRPWCAVTLPQNAMGDIQTAAEHVVHAVREMRARSGRKVDVMGHSQGGMVPRWAIRFWPDVRADVDDLVGLAPSNHGTIDAEVVCAVTCQPSIWQQRIPSAFLQTLNSGQETFAGVDYTSVYTRLDEVVVPNLDEATGSSSLRTGDGRRVNVALQDVCPLAVTEHLGIGAYDATAYALALDAFDHDGPAAPSRVGTAPCAQVALPGVDPVTLATRMAGVVAVAGQQVAFAARVPAEPPLRCYVRASCPEGTRSDQLVAGATAARPATATTKRARTRLRVSLRRVGTTGVRYRVRGGKATGRVLLRVVGRSRTGAATVGTRAVRLRAGRATGTLRAPRSARARALRVRVAYGGDARRRPATVARTVRGPR